jgi:hypothetical protein
MSEQQRRDLEVHKNYKVYGGVESKTFGKTVEWGVATNGGPTNDVQSIFLCDDGDKIETTPRTSLEVVGAKCTDKEPAKVIYAKNGDIEIRAPGGQITLIAKNIRIVAEDGSGEITLKSNKIIQTDAPSTKVVGTNVDIAANSQASMMGEFSEVVGGVQASIGTITDSKKGSFIGALLSILGKFEKYLKLYLP